MSRIRAVVLLSFFIVNISVVNAFASIRIHLEYDYIENEIWPQQTEHRLHGSDDYVLSGHDLSVVNSAAGAKEHTMKLGSPTDVAGDWGGQSRITVHVSANSITYRSVGTTSYRVTMIQTDGTQSCRATRNAYLKPGSQYFTAHRMRNREEMHDSEQRWENVTCTITSD